MEDGYLVFIRATNKRFYPYCTRKKTVVTMDSDPKPFPMSASSDTLHAIVRECGDDSVFLKVRNNKVILAPLTPDCIIEDLIGAGIPFVEWRITEW